VAYQQTGWRLDGEGKRRTRSAGCGIGRGGLIGSRALATVPLEQSKRVLRRAEGYYAQYLVRKRRLSTALSAVRWSRLRRGVEDGGRLQEGVVSAVPPTDTTQDCSGVLPEGTPCPARIRRRSAGGRTSVRAVG
jgi:hypothetical protein